MRCFTVSGSSAHEPKASIALVRDERLGLCVALGERGRGRHLELVKLDSRRPPDVHETPATSDGLRAAVRVLVAGVVAYDVPGRDGGASRRFHALVAPDPRDGRVLVRVDTRGPYTRHTDGSVRPLRGTPRVLCAGHFASGDAERLGTAVDALAVLDEGDALLVVPEGGYKARPYVVELVGGSLRCVDRAEDDTAHATDGDGEPV